MSETKTTPTTVDELVSSVLFGLTQVRRADIPAPSDGDAEQVIRAVFTDRGGHLRQRASLKQPTRDASAFATACRFHSGRNMGLWAPVGASLTVGHQRYNELDTVAQVVYLMLRGRSAGAEAWRRAMGV